MKNLKIILLFVAIYANSYAQKLPEKQETGLWKPADVKIDGNADAWINNMQAYNKTVEVYYSLANDDQNLYLFLWTQKPRIIEKLLGGGLSFTINNQGKKEAASANNIVITYPVFKSKLRSTVRGIIINAGDQAVFYREYMNYSPAYRSILIEHLTRTDSTVSIANNTFNAGAKEIKIQGIREIPDTLISVYNDQQIKTGATFRADGSYIYEVSIPIKFIRPLIGDSPKFSYSIRINVFDKQGYFTDPVDHQYKVTDPDFVSSSEFWATYTLAKKP